MRSDGVKAAGGLLIQVLPKAAQDPLLISVLEARLGELESFSSMLLTHDNLTHIFKDLFGDFGLEIFPEEQNLEFKCPCSLERVLGALKLLGPKELNDMLNEDGGAEIICDFCNTKYEITADQLSNLIQELQTASA